MKKIILSITVIAALLVAMIVPALSCSEVSAPVPVPGASGPLVPSVNNSYAIGTASKQWTNIYYSSALMHGSYNITLPSSDQTLVGRTTTDTLTNKTLTSPTITSGALDSASTWGAVAYGGTTLAAGGVAAVTHGLGTTPTSAMASINGTLTVGGTTNLTGVLYPYFSFSSNSTTTNITMIPASNSTVAVFYWIAK